MGVMLDQEGKPVSGRNDKDNSNFVGAILFPDGNDVNKKQWTKDDGGMEWPDKRYYDTYDYTEQEKIQSGKFGDGTRELGPFYYVKYNNIPCTVSEWYADSGGGAIVWYAGPWVIRGGSFFNGTTSGIFAMSVATGGPVTVFRLVLSP